MRIRFTSALLALFWMAGIGFLLLAITAGIRNYSPVPFGDMWFGYLNFYQGLTEYGLERLWAQHNEHRIVLSRLLFWFDLAVLRGQLPFLQVTNYLLALLLWLSVCALASEQMRTTDTPQLSRYLAPLLLIPCFSLIQYENFYWGFQSQFFLVNLLPLCAFLSLNKSTGKHSSTLWFLVACVFGLLSAGSMINGVLALPIMLLQGMLLRIRRWQTLTLLSLSAGTFLVYFWNYEPIARHGSLLTTFTEHPLKLLQYILLYLGSPAYHFFANSQELALFAGFFLLTSSIYFLYRALSNLQHAHTITALLALLLFIGGTALGTGGGRLQFGLQQALSYRYATPALLAWSAILILYVQLWSHVIARKPALLALGLLCPLAAFPAQWRFQQISHFPSTFDGKVAVMALQMGVHDPDALQKISVHGNPRWMLDATTKKISARGLSIFALSEIQRTGIPLGQPVEQHPKILCLGHIESIQPILGEDRFLKVKGWLFSPTTEQPPTIVSFVDQRGKIAGYALTGQERLDVEESISQGAKYSGFTGYLLKNKDSLKPGLLGEKPGCYRNSTP